MSAVVAVSCPDIAAPRGGQVRRTDDDVAIVTCINSNEVWYLTCKGVKWDGQYGNCSHGQLRMSLVCVHLSPTTEWITYVVCSLLTSVSLLP